MNDPELDLLLKSAAPPPRAREYWREFPAQVRRSLREESSRSAGKTTSAWGPFWKLGISGVGVAMVAVLLFKFTGTRATGAMELGELRKCYREVAGLFPGRLQAVVFEAGQFRLQLSDRSEVPDSPPLLVRVCRASRCATVVTFSGQEVEVLGHKFEVLADGRGGILFLGQEGVWKPGQAPVGEEWRFEAAGLEGRL